MTATNPVPKDADFFRYDPKGPEGPLVLEDGRLLTSELAEELSARAEHIGPPPGLVPGGKSLSGGAVHSPRVVVTLSVQTRKKVEAAAEAEGMSMSKWVRQLIESNVA